MLPLVAAHGDGTHSSLNTVLEAEYDIIASMLRNPDSIVTVVHMHNTLIVLLERGTDAVVSLRVGSHQTALSLVTISVQNR